MIILSKIKNRAIYYLSKVSWSSLLLALVFLFISSWAGIYFFEGKDSALVPLKTFWWFFFVTGTTVGYGDFSPVTTGGRIITVALMMMGGISLIGAFIGKITVTINGWIRKMVEGKGNFSSYENHIVVLGYHQDRTEKMIEHILNENKDEKAQVILCTTKRITNPMPDEIQFVVSESLASDDLMERAGIANASMIYIMGHDDNQTLTTGLATSYIINERARVIAFFHQSDVARLLDKRSEQIHCIVSVTDAMMVREMEDPGSYGIINQLLEAGKGNTDYHMIVPENVEGIKFLSLILEFREKFEATPIAVITKENNSENVMLKIPNDFVIKSGMTIHYTSDRRIAADKINWKAAS